MPLVIRVSPMVAVFCIKNVCALDEELRASWLLLLNSLCSEPEISLPPHMILFDSPLLLDLALRLPPLCPSPLSTAPGHGHAAGCNTPGQHSGPVGLSTPRRL